MAIPPSRPLRESHVESVESVESVEIEEFTFFLKEKKTPPNKSAGEFNLSQKQSAGQPSSSPITIPATFPPYPTSVTGFYKYPKMPRIEKFDRPTDRLRKLIAGYQAAMEYHTQEQCSLYARGAPRPLTKTLLTSASVLLRHDLSPYLWCVVVLASDRVIADEKGKTWRPARLKELYAPGRIDKLHAMVRTQKEQWCTGSWTPPGIAELCSLWDTCRIALRHATTETEATQEELADIVSQYFPPGLFDARCEEIRQAMLRKRQADVAAMRQGRWVW